MECRFIAISAALLWVAIVSAATATTPQYQIYDIGVIDPGDDASQGFGVSHGGIAVGRSIRTGGSQAFTWTLKAASLGCRILPGAITRSRTARMTTASCVGTAATTLFGTSRLPVIWQNGVVSQLPLPAGETLGDANSVNSSGVAVGSVDAGSLQRGRDLQRRQRRRSLRKRQRTEVSFVTAFGINDIRQPHRGPGDRSDECRTQRWDRL